VFPLLGQDSANWSANLRRYLQNLQLHLSVNRSIFEGMPNSSAIRAHESRPAAPGRAGDRARSILEDPETKLLNPTIVGLLHRNDVAVDAQLLANARKTPESTHDVAANRGYVLIFPF